MEIKIDHPPDFAVRYGFGKPESAPIKNILERNSGRISEFISMSRRYRDCFSEIDFDKGPDPFAPFWLNGWFPIVDGIALYSAIAGLRPSIFLEIGSGNSTKFARKAIRDHSLGTRLISLDPQPRAEIDQISDVVIRKPLEQVDLSVFRDIAAGDFVFFDGSHRCFQNSDVTVFFLDVLPELPSGTIVGIHDIFWPQDYPEAWKDRYYNEQYVLGAYMLGAGNALEIVFASSFASRYLTEQVHALIPSHILARYVSEKRLIGGGCLFFRKP